MRALLIIDMQNDFMPEGALGVEGADHLVPLINELMEKFPLVVATKDWHPQGHQSFGDPWPVHCVQESKGAEFVTGLKTEKIDRVILKGIEDEGYTAFLNTELDTFLKEKGVDALSVVGVATDFCVLETVLSALKLGYKVFVIEDGCKAIGSHAKGLEAMRDAGAEILRSGEVA